jgi:hypothetical protein
MAHTLEEEKEYLKQQVMVSSYLNNIYRYAYIYVSVSKFSPGGARPSNGSSSLFSKTSKVRFTVMLTQFYVAFVETFLSFVTFRKTSVFSNGEGLLVPSSTEKGRQGR